MTEYPPPTVSIPSNDGGTTNESIPEGSFRTAQNDDMSRKELKLNEDILQENIDDKLLVTRRTWKWYYYYTTLQGIEQMRKTDGPFIYIWLALFLTGVGMTIYSVHSVIDRFMAKKIVSQVQLVAESQLFPNVAICNVGRINCHHLYEKITECLKDPICKGTRLDVICHIFDLAICSTSISYANFFMFPHGDFSDANKFQPAPCAEFVEAPYKATIEKEYKFDQQSRKDLIIELLDRLTDDELKNTSQKPRRMVMDCSFGDEDSYGEEGADLRKNDEIALEACEKMRSGGNRAFIEDMGYCALFKPDEPLYIRTGNLANQRSKLKLTVNADSHFYSPLFADSVGFSIYIYDQDDQPAKHISRLVRPHTRTKFRMKRIESNVEKVADKCHSLFSQSRGIALYEAIKVDKYHQDICEDACLIDKALRKFNCRIVGISRDWFNLTHGLLYEKRPCSYTEWKDAIKSYREECKSCPPECTTTSFRFKQSVSMFPMDHEIGKYAFESNITDSLKNANSTEEILTVKDVNERLTMLESQTLTSRKNDTDALATIIFLKAHVRDNFAQIVVGFDSSVVYKHVDEHQFPRSAMLDALGGAISLYLGMTVMSIFEMAEFLVRLIIALFFTTIDDPHKAAEMEGRRTLGQDSSTSGTTTETLSHKPPKSSHDSAASIPFSAATSSTVDPSRATSSRATSSRMTSSTLKSAIPAAPPATDSSRMTSSKTTLSRNPSVSRGAIRFAIWEQPHLVGTRRRTPLPGPLEALDERARILRTSSGQLPVLSSTL